MARSRARQYQKSSDAPDALFESISPPLDIVQDHTGNDAEVDESNKPGETGRLGGPVAEADEISEADILERVRAHVQTLPREKLPALAKLIDEFAAAANGEVTAPGNFPTVPPTPPAPATPRPDLAPIARRVVPRAVTAEELAMVPAGLQVKQHKKYDFAPEDLGDPDKVTAEQSISNARKRKIRAGVPLSEEEDERGRMAEAFVKRAGRHGSDLKPG